MIFSRKISAVLDANVLYVSPVRDLYLRLATAGTYLPRWSRQIQEEWTKNLLKKRPDLLPDRVKRTTNFMNNAFPEALVDNFIEITEALELPDTDDRHVLAAAIKCHAYAIVTFNIKDFPKNYIAEYNIKVYHPDDFLKFLNNQSPFLVREAFNSQLNALKKPPVTKQELLNTLTECQIKSAKSIFGD